MISALARNRNRNGGLQNVELGQYLDNISNKLVDLEDGRQTKLLHHKVTMMEFSMLLFNFIGIYSSVLYVRSTTTPSRGLKLQNLLKFLEIRQKNFPSLFANFFDFFSMTAAS